MTAEVSRALALVRAELERLYLAGEIAEPGYSIALNGLLRCRVQLAAAARKNVSTNHGV